MNLDVLRQYDSELISLEVGNAKVLVSPGLQGRIFCAINGKLIHRLDQEKLANPLPNAFNNLGGNSLWPAPEGGPFAFNYPPDGGAWYVQEGIASSPAKITARDALTATMQKNITLVNRKGTSVSVEVTRTVRLRADSPWAVGLPEGVSMLHYEVEDVLSPKSKHAPSDLLLAAWSLEQFPGGNGVTAFTLVEDAAKAINDDYYGVLPQPPVVAGSLVSVPLGGQDRFQIGIPVSAGPHLIGVIDTVNGLLIIRRTPRQDGRYFNIADNDQPKGPESAADMYSVFNGGALDFYELETIAPLQIKGSTVGASHLKSETIIFTGSEKSLRMVLQKITTSVRSENGNTRKFRDEE